MQHVYTDMHHKIIVHAGTHRNPPTVTYGQPLGVNMDSSTGADLITPTPMHEDTRAQLYVILRTVLNRIICK